MKRTIRLFCLILAFTMLLCGCAPVSPAPEEEVAPSPEQNAPVSASPLRIGTAMEEAMPLMAPDYGTENLPAETAAKGANDFAFRFTAALLEQNGMEEDLICSPYSAWLPLAALLNATSKDKQPALLEALGAAGITQEQLNEAASRMLYSLTNQQEKDWMEKQKAEMEEIRAKEEAAGVPFNEADWVYDVHDPLRIANAVFVDDDCTLNETFAKRFLDYYRGAAMEVDFADPSAVDAVNQWASENTNGLIEEVVTDFPDDLVAAIANAIYFSARWDWEFDPSETEEMTFHGTKADVPAMFMLREGEMLPYYEDDTLQAMPLPFSTGGELMILLPKDGDAVSLLSNMTAERFEKIQQNTQLRTGKLLLPRFSIESDPMDLVKPLAEMGVPLFDSGDPALTELVDETSAYIAQAIQKALIKVDEKGTTAAAVTVMAAAGAAMPQPTEPFSMVCDRPFAFVLYGRTYDAGSQVLFTGVLNQPAEQG